eukprot:7320349-Prymnesium_polylepis.1
MAFSRPGFRHVQPGRYSPAKGSDMCCRVFGTVEVEQSQVMAAVRDEKRPKTPGLASPGAGAAASNGGARTLAPEGASQ